MDGIGSSFSFSWWSILILVAVVVGYFVISGSKNRWRK